MKYIDTESTKSYYNWKSLSLSELIQIIFNMELTHLGSEASNQIIVIHNSYKQKIKKSLF